MPAKRHLRAVDEGVSKPDRPRSVADAAASGDHLALLVAMRERVARAVSSVDCPPRDLAALTRRLQDIAREIELIEQRAKDEGQDAADRDSDGGEWDQDAI